MCKINRCFPGYAGLLYFIFLRHIEFTCTVKENRIGHTRSFQNRFLLPFSAVRACVHTTILWWSKYSGLSANSCSFTSLSSAHEYSYLPQIIYFYHSSFSPSLNFLLLTANFLAQENSFLPCIFFFFLRIKVITFLQL